MWWLGSVKLTTRDGYSIATLQVFYSKIFSQSHMSDDVGNDFEDDFEDEDVEDEKEDIVDESET